MESTKAEQRKTLMSALDSLSEQRENLYDLSLRSDTMRDKMQRTEDQPKTDSGDIPSPPLNGTQDIVDLFNNVTMRMQELIEITRKNINKTIDLID